MVEMTYFDDIKRAASLNLPWEKLSGSKILVTGATGLIGSCFIEVLMTNRLKNYTVYASGRNEVRARKRFRKYWDDAHFFFLKFDVAQPLDCEYHFDYIIHAASGAAPSAFADHPVEVMKANFLGVINLMEYGLAHGMKRFLYISSGEVYGEGDGRIFTEKYSGYVDPTSARSCYPSSKRAAETLCASYANQYGVDVVIARPSHTYGPYFTETDNRVYAQFIRNVLNGEDIVMKSSGVQFRSWCYVVDCISALLFILLKGEKGLAYNIADTSSNITIHQLADMVAEIGQRRVVLELPSDTKAWGGNPVTKSVFSTERLEQLGWSVVGTMKEKMRHTIEECKNNIA